MCQPDLESSNSLIGTRKKSKQIADVGVGFHLHDLTHLKVDETPDRQSRTDRFVSCRSVGVRSGSDLTYHTIDHVIPKSGDQVMPIAQHALGQLQILEQTSLLAIVGRRVGN